MVNNIAQPKQKKRKMGALQVPINGLIIALDNIKLKVDAAAGAATLLEMHLRIIAQTDPRVQSELRKIQISRKARRESYHRANLKDLIDAVIEVYRGELDPIDQAAITNCHIPRNKVSHGSFAELMIALNGKALGREIDPLTMKRKPLDEEDVIEGVLSIERNGGLEEFDKQAKKAITILREKVFPCLSSL